MLIKPDFVDGPAHVRMRWVNPGEKFIRLAAAKYGATSYNPKIPKNRPRDRGRFSGTKADPFATMYIADFTTDESLVILEVAAEMDLETNPGGSVHYIQQEQVKGLAFHYLEVTHRFPVVRLTGPRDPEGLGANWDSLFSDNYWYSRQWARYIRKRSPDAKGLEYVSVKNRDSRDGAALVLFGDRIPMDVVKQFRPSVAADGREGADIFVNCQDKTGIVPAW